MDSDQEHQPSNENWHCGGWEGAEAETLRIMRAMSFEQKIRWLEQAQRLVAEMHGWPAALQPGGTLIKPPGMKESP